MRKAAVQQSAIVQSMAACSGSIGARAALQLDRAWRKMTLGHGAEQETGYVRLLTGEQHPLGNAAIVCDPDGLSTTRSAVTPLLERDLPSMVLYPAGVAGPVAAWLLSRGYAAHGSMPAMAVDIARLAPTSLPRGLEWVRVGTGAQARAWAEATASGFGIPVSLAARFSPVVLGADMASDAQIQFYAMRRNGRIVSTSLLLLADGLAGLYNISTLAAERGRGLGAHMTAQTLRLAQALGYRVGVLQSSDAGHPVYQRLGFADCAAIPLFVRTPS
jgi:GNAT superfamily N-acetyltransferase